MALRKRIVTGTGLTLVAIAVVAVTPVGRDARFHLLPLRWTGEATRLAAALDLKPGDRIADIGAGSGALTIELARVVGPQGRVYATERTPEQRDAIAARASPAPVVVEVLEAPDRTTGLPDQCCDAIVLRLVLHHITGHESYAVDLARALRPGGRVAIIDFAPGALPFLANDHGVSPEPVINAFAAAGLTLQSRHDDWGGRTYLVVFGAR